MFDKFIGVYGTGYRGGKLLRWIENWLKDRCQRVVLNGVESG